MSQGVSDRFDVRGASVTGRVLNERQYRRHKRRILNCLVFTHIKSKTEKGLCRPLLKVLVRGRCQPNAMAAFETTSGHLGARLHV